MSVVGCLGDIPFVVSADMVQTIDNAVWSGSAKYAMHQRHITHALTEFVGLNSDKFSFDMTVSAYLGVNPMDAIVKLWEYERAHTPVSLVIGEKGYGKYRWCVTDHKVSMKAFDRTGAPLVADVSVSLIEYLRDWGVAYDI